MSQFQLSIIGIKAKLHIEGKKETQNNKLLPPHLSGPAAKHSCKLRKYSTNNHHLAEKLNAMCLI